MKDVSIFETIIANLFIKSLFSVNYYEDFFQDLSHHIFLIRNYYARKIIETYRY